MALYLALIAHLSYHLLCQASDSMGGALALRIVEKKNILKIFPLVAHGNQNS